MKSQILYTVWSFISGEAAGEVWNWSLLGVKGLSPQYWSQWVMLCNRWLTCTCMSNREDAKRITIRMVLEPERTWLTKTIPKVFSFHLPNLSDFSNNRAKSSNGWSFLKNVSFGSVDSHQPDISTTQNEHCSRSLLCLFYEHPHRDVTSKIGLT